jgi:hypothetical protein
MFNSNLLIDSNERNRKEFIGYRLSNAEQIERVRIQRRSNAENSDKFGDQSGTTRVTFIRPITREKRTHCSQPFSISNYQSAVSVNGLPSSCSDLKMIRHSLNGFYSIVGSAMMESVFCDFSKLPSEPGK